PGRGAVGGHRRRGPGPAPHRHRAPGHRRPGRPGRARRAVVPAPGLPARGAAGAHCAARRIGPARSAQRRAMITIGPAGVSPADVLAIARTDANAQIAKEAVAAMEESRSIVDSIERDGRPVYGVSTGFGALASTFVAPERRAELQYALIRSHAAGIGAPMPREGVRAMTLLRGRALPMGRARVRPPLAGAPGDLLHHHITPWGPEHGALGASGDLAPLAHCALTLLGEGWVLADDGSRVPSATALAAAGLSPVDLAAKEGLALINGTDGMLGMLLLALDDARHLLTMAD